MEMPVVCLWRGRPLEDLSRDELIEADMTQPGVPVGN